MNGKRMTMAWAGAMALGLSAPAVQADDTAALRAELDALRAEVAQMRGEQDRSWMDERRAEEVKTLVAEVLADADTRATMLQDGMTAGHDGGGFFLASPDNSFRLNIGGQVQLRYYANFRDDAGAGHDTTTGFQHRRTRVTFSGHIADPRITYRVQTEVRRQDGRLQIADLYLGYKFNDQLSFTAGRMKLPFFKEDLHSSARQLTVERSLVNSFFGLGRGTGVQVQYNPVEDVRLYGMFSDGTGTGLHDFSPAIDADQARVALTGRGEVKLAGEWGQYRHFAGWSGDPFGLILGGAMHWEQNRGVAGSPFTRFGTTRDFLTWTADASLYMENVSVFAAAVGRHDTATIGDAPKFDDYGFLVQGGYTINDQIQPFARWEYIRPDRSRPGVDSDDAHLLTFGANYFLKGHNAKLTSDIVWALDSLPSGAGGLGLLPDAPGEKNQVVWRTQFQLLF